MFKAKVFGRLFVMATAVAFLLLAFSAAFSQTKLLRFPDIHGDRVAFTYGGDIWTAPATGGNSAMGRSIRAMIGGLG